MTMPSSSSLRCQRGDGVEPLSQPYTVVFGALISLTRAGKPICRRRGVALIITRDIINHDSGYPNGVYWRELPS